MKALQHWFGFAVGVAAFVGGGGAAYVHLLPPKVAAPIVGVAGCILAVNGALVPNGHKDPQ